MELFAEHYKRTGGTEAVVLPSESSCSSSRLQTGGLAFPWAPLAAAGSSCGLSRRGLSSCMLPGGEQALETFASVTPALTFITDFCTLTLCQAGRIWSYVYGLIYFSQQSRKLDIIIPIWHIRQVRIRRFKDDTAGEGGAEM